MELPELQARTLTEVSRSQESTSSTGPCLTGTYKAMPDRTYKAMPDRDEDMPDRDEDMPDRVCQGGTWEGMYH